MLLKPTHFPSFLPAALLLGLAAFAAAPALAETGDAPTTATAGSAAADTPSTATAAASDLPATPTLIRVSLAPVLKPPPRVVELAPVRKGERHTPTPAPAPKPADEPAPAPAATPEAAATPAPEPAPEATPAPAPEAAPAPAATPPPKKKPAPKPAPAPAPDPTPAADAMRRELVALMRAPENEETLAALKQYVAGQKPQAQTAGAQMRIGQIELTLGRPAAAEAAFNDALSSASRPLEQALAIEGLVQSRLRRGDGAGADAAWQRLRAEFPNHPTAPQTGLDAALLKLLQGRPAEAENIWREVEQTLGAIDPGAAAPMRDRLALDRALAAELAGRRDDALVSYQKLAQGTGPVAETAQRRLKDLRRPLAPLPSPPAPAPDPATVDSPTTATTAPPPPSPPAPAPGPPPRRPPTPAPPAPAPSPAPAPAPASVDSPTTATTATAPAESPAPA